MKRRCAPFGTLLLHACLAMSLAAAQPAVESTRHARSEREHSFVVALPVTQAFTLFEPLGEKNWAEGWQPVFPAPDDARPHDGSVFTVDLPQAGSEPVHSVWTVTRYDPPSAIEYHNVLVGIRATRISVCCQAADAHTTRVTVRYVYTGLSDRGDRLIGSMTEQTFSTMIEDWATAIAGYLQRGTPASP